MSFSDAYKLAYHCKKCGGFVTAFDAGEDHLCRECRKPKRTEISETQINRAWGQIGRTLTIQVKIWLRDELVNVHKDEGSKNEV